MRKTFILFFLIFSASIYSASKLFTMHSQPESEAANAQNDSVKNFQNEINELPEMTAPRIVVKKADRKLQVFDGEKLVKTYKIGLGFAPVGDKEKQGDGKTPEGEFYIFTKNPKSSYYLSLGISYPSTDDAERGLRDKLISKSQHDEIVKAVKNKKTPLQNTALGGEIYIHGNGSKTDWTLGCVALEDAEMKELFDAIPIGTSVRIEP